MDIMNFKQDLASAYNADATRRDKNEETRESWKLDARQRFADLLHDEGKENVLELGAGAGIDSKYFKEQGFNVFAIDLSEEMVALCKKRGIPAQVLDLYALSTLQKTFDAIYSLNVLLHVPAQDIDPVLRNIHAVLNSGGVFFYGVYGGIDEEEVITDSTKMNLPRLFSFHSDDALLTLVQPMFDVIDFHTIDIGSKRDGFHFQSLLLRKKE